MVDKWHALTMDNIRKILHSLHFNSLLDKCVCNWAVTCSGKMVFKFGKLQRACKTTIEGQQENVPQSEKREEKRQKQRTWSNLDTIIILVKHYSLTIVYSLYCTKKLVTRNSYMQPQTRTISRKNVKNKKRAVHKASTIDKLNGKFQWNGSWCWDNSNKWKGYTASKQSRFT